jgi:hypothetical protein
MKKLFAMMIIAGAFAACNGGSKSGSTDSTSGSSTSTDTSSMSKDTSKMKSDSMVNNAPDTVKAK